MKNTSNKTETINDLLIFEKFFSENFEKWFMVKKFLSKYKLRHGAIVVATIDILYAILLGFIGQYIFAVVTFVSSLILLLGVTNIFQIFNRCQLSISFLWLYTFAIYLCISPFWYLICGMIYPWEIIIERDGPNFSVVGAFFLCFAFRIFSYWIHLYFFRVVFSFHRRIVIRYSTRLKSRQG